MKRFILKKETQKPSEYLIKYSDLLNSQQLKAVMHDSGPALVIAGAGTGKTRTLIYRVARLIESGTDPSSVLLLTFTRRAAREMLDRASSVLDERCNRVKGGTFHFYCSQLLRRYHKEIDFPAGFSIIDSADARDVIQMLRAELKLNRSDKRFPQKSTLLNMISGSVNRQIELSDLVEQDYNQFRDHTEEIGRLKKAYEEYKRKHHLMDFDDLLIRTQELLNTDERVRAEVQLQHKHVMVDEYQDTNALQSALVKLFTPYTQNVMVVGDDAQSIYAFRGADHKNIMQFPELLTGTEIITLEENYRSTANILRVANSVLDQARNKYEKKLFTKREDGELPALVKTEDTREQSRFVSQMIMNLREQEVPLHDVAVLFRNARDSFDLEIELNKKKLPFIKYGGQKFADAAHIKDVLAHLRVIENPADALSWTRILMLIDGIGPKTASDFMEWLSGNTNPYELASSGLVNESYKSGLYSLSQLLIDLKNGSFTPYEAVGHIKEYYSPICEKKFDDYPKRVKDLEALHALVVDYRDYKHLLEELALDPIEATAIDVEGTSEDEKPLVLSTIHSAKGLEWKHVFLIQCLDGVIPSSFSLNDEDSLEEELRLMYVAVTRACDMLYICYPMLQHGGFGDVMTKPSRFIEHAGQDLLEPWLLTEEEQPINNENLLPEAGAPIKQLNSGK